jgi:hypothetical protein
VRVREGIRFRVQGASDSTTLYAAGDWGWAAATVLAILAGRARAGLRAWGVA